MPVALAVDWEEIRRASEQGIADATLAEQFGVTGGAIRIRRMREKWLTPARQQQEAIIESAKRKAKLLGNHSVTTVTEGSAPSATALVTDEILANGERGTLLLSRISVKSLENVMAEDGTLKIVPLQTIQDVSVAGKAVRLAAGMDKQDATQVNVAVSGWNASVARKTGSSGWVITSPQTALESYVEENSSNDAD